MALGGFLMCIDSHLDAKIMKLANLWPVNGIPIAGWFTVDRN